MILAAIITIIVFGLILYACISMSKAKPFTSSTPTAEQARIEARQYFEIRRSNTQKYIERRKPYLFKEINEAITDAVTQGRSSVCFRISALNAKIFREYHLTEKEIIQIIKEKYEPLGYKFSNNFEVFIRISWV